LGRLREGCAPAVPRTRPLRDALVVLLWRSLEIVAAVLGLLVGLTPVMAASALAYGHAESNRTTSLSDPTGPYAASRVSYHWGATLTTC
jgi:hypothetical protein